MSWVETNASHPAAAQRLDERPYQENLWEFLRGGGKRAIAVWHRRAGKDDIALHHTAIAMHTRVGNYWHCLPEYEQGRKALWTAVNPHTGKRRIDEAFPPEMRERTNENEMFIRFKNGSRPGSSSAATATTRRSAPASWVLRIVEWALGQSVGVGLPPADAGGKRRLGAVHHHAARPEPRQGHVRLGGPAPRLVRRALTVTTPGR